MGNRSFYENSQVDNLLDRAREISDLKEREKYYQDVQKIIYDEVPLLPIAYKNYTIGLQRNIEGFVFKPNGNHILSKIERK